MVDTPDKELDESPGESTPRPIDGLDSYRPGKSDQEAAAEVPSGPISPRLAKEPLISPEETARRVMILWNEEYEKKAKAKRMADLNAEVEQEGKVIVDKKNVATSMSAVGAVTSGVGHYIGEIVENLIISAGIALPASADIPMFLENVVVMTGYVLLFWGILRRGDLSIFTNAAKKRGWPSE